MCMGLSLSHINEVQIWRWSFWFPGCLSHFFSFDEFVTAIVGEVLRSACTIRDDTQR